MIDSVSGRKHTSSSQHRISQETKNRLKRNLELNYNKKKAKIASQIILSEVRKYQRGRYTSTQECIREIEHKLQNNKQTAVIVEDIHQTLSHSDKIRSRTLEDIPIKNDGNSISTQELVKDPEGSHILFGRVTDVNASGSAYSQVTSLDNDLDAQENMEAGATLYGSSYAEVVRTISFEPDESGTWSFDWDYETSGTVNGSGTVTIQILLDDMTEEVVTTLDSKPNQSGTATTQFDLDKGEVYTLGMKYFVSADALISAGISRFLDSGYIQPMILTATGP